MRITKLTIENNVDFQRFFTIKNNKIIQIEPMTIDFTQKYFDNNYRGRYLAKANCDICGKDFIRDCYSIFGRKRVYGNGHYFCSPTCGVKFATSQKGWKEKNSKAQLIAQNRPEVKAKMRASVKASKTPELLRKHSEASKKMWLSEEYRKKHRESMKKAFKNMSQESKDKMSYKNRFHSGWYNSDKFGKMYFNSSWELAFIVWCENNTLIETLKRCDDTIPYKDKNGKERFYYPDFEIKSSSGIQIIEIKGKRNLNNVEEKKIHAKNFYKNEKDYCLYFYNDLIKLKVLNRNFKAFDFCMKHIDKIENLNGLKKGIKENVTC